MKKKIKRKYKFKKNKIKINTPSLISILKKINLNNSLIPFNLLIISGKKFYFFKLNN